MSKQEFEENRRGATQQKAAELDYTYTREKHLEQELAALRSENARLEKLVNDTVFNREETSIHRAVKCWLGHQDLIDENARLREREKHADELLKEGNRLLSEKAALLREAEDIIRQMRATTGSGRVLRLAQAFQEKLRDRERGR